MGPPYHIYAFGHGGPLQSFRKIAVAKLANKRLVAYQGPGADPGEDVGGSPPHQPFSTMLWINKVFYNFEPLHNHGCKSMEGCIPPNNPAASPPNIFMSQNWAPAKVMTFFWSSLYCGQKIGHLQTCQFC